MFRRGKTGETDVKKAIQKVLDNRKDNITRLKHLKIILENSEPKDAKTLFEDNSSLVFYIFYDVFINVESDLKQRVNRAHKEELDTVLFVFEKVFLLVPDLIHRRWQYNCIGRLIRKLLHPNNSIKIRREGVRLFLIWYQILQDNASDECHELFSRLVPRLSPLPAVASTPGSSGSAGVGGASRVSTAPASRQSHSRQGSGTLAAVTSASHDAVTPVDISPILPPQGHTEEVCEDYTLEFLHALLQRMISEVVKIEWPEAEKPTRRRQALHFLLEQFKRFYLPVLFPPIPSQKTSCHAECPLYPGGPSNISILSRLASERDGLVVNDIPTRKLTLYQEEVIRWLAEFVYVGLKSSLTSASSSGITAGQLSEHDADVSGSVMDVAAASGGIGGGPGAVEMGVAFPRESVDGGAAISSGDHGAGGIPVGGSVHGHGTGAGVGSPGGQAPILREPEFPMGAALTLEQVELVRSVLYATRENVLLIHELFSRTLSQFAAIQHRAVSCVVTVYREWIRQAVKGHRPPFMREPLADEAAGDGAEEAGKIGEEDGEQQSSYSADQSVETEEDTVRDSDTDGSSMHTPSETSPAHRIEGPAPASDPCRPPSPEMGSAQARATTAWLSSGSVAAGLQRCLQVIFTSSAHVFVLRVPSGQGSGQMGAEVSSEFLKSHEIICKMVLWFYRHATIQLILSADTWEKLLMVLLRIVWDVMSSTNPEDTNSLGSLLAGPLFQTLIVTFVKANLHIRVSCELWDKFMSVLSSLTHWPQLIAEWSKTMGTLTRLLAKHVYGLDLRDLPLDRPSKARSRRQNILSRSQHGGSAAGGPFGASQASKSRSHDRVGGGKTMRGISRMTHAFDHPNLQLADSFSCVKLEDDSSTGPLRAPPDSTHAPSARPQSAIIAGVAPSGPSSGGHPSPSPSSASARASSRSSVDPSGGGGIGEEVQPLLHSSSSSVGGTGGHNTLSSVASIGPGPGGSQIEHDSISQTSSTTSDRQSGAMFGGGSGGGGGDDTSSYASATEDAASYGVGSTSGMPVPISAGSASTGCNVSLGFSDTELLSSSIVPSGDAGNPTSDMSGSDESDSSVDSDLSSDTNDPDSVRRERTLLMTAHRRPQRHPRLRHRRKPAAGKGGKGGTLTRDDVTGMALSEEEEVDVEHKEEDDEEEEDRHDAEDEDDENEDDDEDTTNGHAGSLPMKGKLSERPVVSCSAERLNTDDPELLSVMAGGRAVGWTAENCVVLWRRILCSLGDINAIADPTILRTVYEHLSDIMHNLFNLRRNLGVSLDNVTTPAPPLLIPPLTFMVSWFFNTLQLPPSYKQAKLLAMRLLCRITISRHDVALPVEHIAQFHRELHYALAVNPDQDIVNEVLDNCGPNFFSLSLSGSCLLLLDFIEAAGSLLVSQDRDAPRVEAVSILGSLLCYPTHYRQQGQSSVAVLRPPAGSNEKTGSSRGLQVTSVPWTEIKDNLVDRLLRWGMRETAGTAKAVALSSLGIFVYEELASYPRRAWKLHHRVKDAMAAIYQALRLSEKQVACDMLSMLVDHVELLLHEHPDLPLKVVEQCAQALQTLMNERRDTSRREKRLIVSLILCLVEWCMHLPLSLLLDSTDSHGKGLIFLVFRVLHCVARGGHHVTPWHSAVSALLPQSQAGHPPSVAGSELDWDGGGRHLDQLGQLSASAFESSLSAGLASIDGSTVGSPSDATSPSSDSHGGDASSPASQAPGGGGARTMRSPKLSSRDGLDMVRLAARTALSHLLNHLGQFPVTAAARLDSFVQEWQEVDLLGLDAPLSDLTPGLFRAPNLQLFTVNDCALLSLLTLPSRRQGGDAEDGLVDGQTVVRAIVRDVGGKYSWDARVLYGGGAATPSSRLGGTSGQSTPGSLDAGARRSSESARGGEEEEEKEEEESEMEHEDHLRELLASLEKSSPELSLQPPSKPAPSLDDASAALEDVAKQQLHAQEMWEEQTLLRIDSDPNPEHRLSVEDASNYEHMSPFYACRHILSQLGYLTWERRPHIDLLKKKDNLLLELKNLDMRACRETHKIAVIYVGPGQEDKQSVLSNSSGSRAFEDFVAGLGWEVVLDRHPGFRGGLDCSGRTGLSTPYYATSTLEIIYHVATRMPSASEEDRHRKLKHLGNDEIWLVWSEHERDFRRGLIPTEFGDVMIVVYPLQDRAGLFRVAIDRKPEIPYFGPLFDGAVVSDHVLPGLVRATAINASRVNRALKEGYLSFYEERSRCLDDIIQKYKKSTTFESFARHTFAPILPDDGVVPNSPTDHPDGLRAASTSRASHEQGPGGIGASDKKEGKPKVRFPPNQIFFGDSFYQDSLTSDSVTPDVLMRSRSPSRPTQSSQAAEVDPKLSIVRRFSMKTRKTILQSQSLKRQSSPSGQSPGTSPPAYPTTQTSPRPKATSPSGKDVA